MPDDFCLIHGYEFMRHGVPHQILVCGKCEDAPGHPECVTPQDTTPPELKAVLAKALANK